MKDKAENKAGTLHLAGWRRSLVTFAAAVLCFAALDGVARWVDPLHLYGGWENPHVQYKLNFAREMARENGRLDVLVLSTSIGLHVDVEKWTEATGGKVSCYNGAIGGQRPEFARFLFENVYYPELRPSHVIYLLCPRDVNNGGLPQPIRNAPQLWESYQVRKRTASTFGERVTVALETASYLYQTRRHVRRLIQSGPAIQNDYDVTRLTGVNEPSIRRVGDTPVSEKEKREGTPYSKFSMPDNGEVLQLRKLADFCKAKGVEFVVVNQQVAPAAHTAFDDPQRDYAAYLAGLDKLRRDGIRVLDMAAALKLSNREFSDHDHMNRWGGLRAADYLYREVIRPWFPDKCLVASLPKPEELHLHSLLSRTNPAFLLQDRRYIPLYGSFAAPLQATAFSPGGSLAPTAPVPPGKYLLELYTGDERTSPTPNAPGHRIAVEIRPTDGSSPRTVEVEQSRKGVAGSLLNTLRVDVGTTSRLAVGVKGMAGTECILDSLFVRPIAGSVPETNPLVGRFVADSAVADPYLVRNGGFEFEDPRRPGNPAEWEPYTRDGIPWGTVRLVDGGRDGKRALQLTHSAGKGWGCVQMQHVNPATSARLLGKVANVSVWVRGAARQDVHVAVDWEGSGTEAPKFAEAGKSGDWTQLNAKVTFPAKLENARFLIGALNGKQVVVDGFDVTLD